MLRGRVICADRAHRLREQRAEDDLSALVHRRLRAGLRALRRTAVVLHQQLDVGILEIGQRQLGGILQRRADAGATLSRHRQDQADAHLALADFRAGRRGQRRVGAVLPNLPKSPRSNLLSAQADSANAVLAHNAARSTRLRVSDPGGL